MYGGRKGDVSMSGCMEGDVQVCGGRECDMSMCVSMEGDVQVCGGINISGEG